MLQILLGVIILLPCSQAFPTPVDKSLLKDNLDEDKYKNYLDKFFPHLNKTVSPTLQERIKEMQKFFHLTITGKMDTETRKLMKQPRCGVPDVAEFRSGPRVWNRKALTYRINNYTPDLPRHSVDQIIQRAFNVWSEVTPLTFHRVYGPADIEILFAYGAHGDGNPFDGRGGVLAHAYFPGRDIGGDAHFDESEKWSERNREISLFLVAAHEFGHSLGLTHSRVRGALMFSTYSYMNPNTFRLHDDDRKRIQRLYAISFFLLHQEEDNETLEELRYSSHEMKACSRLAMVASQGIMVGQG
uniref:matrilysin-like n=1 Tax=Euleptes europaea TaxID=460621 RepID=UPI00253F9016|nr:matrilysin-like [Euleptes europaea]